MESDAGLLSGEQEIVQGHEQEIVQSLELLDASCKVRWDTALREKLEALREHLHQSRRLFGPPELPRLMERCIFFVMMRLGVGVEVGRVHVA